jgi:hypothetical protein
MLTPPQRQYGISSGMTNMLVLYALGLASDEDQPRGRARCCGSQVQPAGGAYVTVWARNILYASCRPVLASSVFVVSQSLPADGGAVPVRLSRVVLACQLVARACSPGAH